MSRCHLVGLRWDTTPGCCFAVQGRAKLSNSTPGTTMRSCSVISGTMFHHTQLPNNLVNALIVQCSRNPSMEQETSIESITSLHHITALRE